MTKGDSSRPISTRKTSRSITTSKQGCKSKSKSKSQKKLSNGNTLRSLRSGKSVKTEKNDVSQRSGILVKKSANKSRETLKNEAAGHENVDQNII